MEVTIDHTPLLTRTYQADDKIVVHEGGSGSSKTYSLLQLYAVLSFSEPNSVYSVVRRSMPALKRSALRDMRIILYEAGIAHAFDEQKTDHIFTNKQTGTIIEFFSLEDEQKARGPRRDRLYVNEANELGYDPFSQLLRRTRGQVFIDYNPSMQRHWIYDRVLSRDDCLHILSTYKDNTFLTTSEVREIEVMVPVYEEPDGTQYVDWNLDYGGGGRMIAGDPYQWAVYGLGQRGSPGEAIYPVCHTSTYPEDLPFEYGLDFGYNHAMVLGRVAQLDVAPKPRLYVDEIIHERHLTTEDLIELMQDRGVSRSKTIWADASRPDTIKSLCDAGYNCKAAKKGPGSVYNGIQYIKKFDLYFSPRSDRGKAQHEGYRWQKKADGTVSDEPVKLDDDSPDMVRYSQAPYLGVQPQSGRSALINA